MRQIKSLLVVAVFWEAWKAGKEEFIKHKHKGTFNKKKSWIKEKFSRLRRKKVKVKKDTQTAIFNIDGMDVLVFVHEQKDTQKGIMFKVSPVSGFSYSWQYAEEIIIEE